MAARFGTGSSPLARGTHTDNVLSLVGIRFIPARAGNTTQVLGLAASAAVHPRSRGEHWMNRRRMSPSCGSSPLARGTLIGQSCLNVRPRFIPARAGNTWTGGTHPRKPSVHPRSRGEHMDGWYSPAQAIGSSPLARGTPGMHLDVGEPVRFIPARAGNTALIDPLSVTGAVHPRSRGEHTITPATDAGRAGSSPLARGTHGCDATGIG